MILKPWAAYSSANVTISTFEVLFSQSNLDSVVVHLTNRNSDDDLVARGNVLSNITTTASRTKNFFGEIMDGLGVLFEDLKKRDDQYV